MYEIEEKWDLSHNDGVFRMSIEDLWRKKGEFKNFIELNKDDDTYSIIPSLENLEKRLMLLIGCSLKEKFGFWHVQHKNFIIELPNAFQKIINSLNNLYFEFRIFENVFSVTLNHNASHLEITYSGTIEYDSDELLYDIATTLYGSETGKKIHMRKHESFWED